MVPAGRPAAGGDRLAAVERRPRRRRVPLAHRPRGAGRALRPDRRRGPVAGGRGTALRLRPRGSRREVRVRVRRGRPPARGGRLSRRHHRGCRPLSPRRSPGGVAGPDRARARMTDAFYIPDGDAFVATVHTRGPWSPRHQHGGPPAALLARAIATQAPGFVITRVTVDFLLPVPIDRLAVRVEALRAGAKVQRLVARLLHGERVMAQEIGRAHV